MENENFSENLLRLSSDDHLMKNPIILTLFALGIGVFISGMLACLGIRNTNFVLFSAIFVGMAYTASFKEVIPFKLRLKCGLCYFLLGIIICPILNLIWPGSVRGLNEFPLFVLFVIAPLEMVLFAALLHFGSFLEFRLLIPRH